MCDSAIRNNQFMARPSPSRARWVTQRGDPKEKCAVGPERQFVPASARTQVSHHTKLEQKSTRCANGIDASISPGFCRKQLSKTMRAAAAGGGAPTRKKAENRQHAPTLSCE